MGYRPEPYAIADALMYADGKPIVEITDMSLRLTGTTRERLEQLWARVRCSRQAAGPGVFLRQRRSILAFAIGQAVGGVRRALPAVRRGPVHRPAARRLRTSSWTGSSRVDGEPWTMAAGTAAEAEYDIPPDAWYFAGRPPGPRCRSPCCSRWRFQPCGWLAAYMGSALTSDEPTQVPQPRRHGACQHAAVDRRSGTLTHASQDDQGHAVGAG